MVKGIELPEVSPAERAPLVQRRLEIIEKLAAEVQRQEERIGQLEDEIAVLKGQKKRPHVQTQQDGGEGREGRKVRPFPHSMRTRGGILKRGLRLSRIS